MRRLSKSVSAAVKWPRFCAAWAQFEGAFWSQATNADRHYVFSGAPL